MAGESTARSDKSEMNNNNELEVLKDNYETLTREHETLIKTLELLETEYGFTLKDLAKRQREAVVANEETEKWKKKFGELEKRLDEIEKGMEELKLLDETEMDGVDSGSGTPANVDSNNAVSDVIVLSDDDEGGQSESDGGHVNSPSEFSFYM